MSAKSSSITAVATLCLVTLNWLIATSGRSFVYSLSLFSIFLITVACDSFYCTNRIWHLIKVSLSNTNAFVSFSVLQCVCCRQYQAHDVHNFDSICEFIVWNKSCEIVLRPLFTLLQHTDVIHLVTFECERLFWKDGFHVFVYRYEIWWNCWFWLCVILKACWVENFNNFALLSLVMSGHSVLQLKLNSTENLAVI